MPAGGAECDFCSSPNIAWAYPCRDFIIMQGPGLPDQGSTGAWSACPACHALLERGDRERLAQRSAKRFARKHGISFKLALQGVRASQDGFWAHREGAPVPAERWQSDPTPAGRVDPKHKLGPDYDAAERAVREPVKAILSMRTTPDRTPTVVYYYPTDRPHVHRVDVAERDGQLVQIGEPRSLGGDWADVRLRVDLGLA